MLSSPSSASCMTVAAVNVLVMLPATNGVAAVTAVPAAAEPTPETPDQRLSSGMITAADMPGMPFSARTVSSALWRCTASSGLTAAGVGVGVGLGDAVGLGDVVGLGLGVGLGEGLAGGLGVGAKTVGVGCAGSVARHAAKRMARSGVGAIQSRLFTGSQTVHSTWDARRETGRDRALRIAGGLCDFGRDVSLVGGHFSDAGRLDANPRAVDPNCLAHLAPDTDLDDGHGTMCGGSAAHARPSSIRARVQRC